MNQQILRQLLMQELASMMNRNGGWVTRAELESVYVDGEKYRLIDTTKGIFNPKSLDSTLSIMSSPKGPYEDVITAEGLLEYAYQSGTTEGVHKKLRKALENQDPIILLKKIATGVYAPIFPVFIVGDDPVNRKVLVAVDESLAILGQAATQTPLQKQYVERIVKQRLHQPEFRSRVIRAYETRCAVCSLAHGELLDAAHIIPDSHELGVAEVSNGLSLCKIHHSAYDQFFLGISPDFKVVINDDLLAEKDGPMLKHGIQEMHGRTILLPATKSQRPNPQYLESRFEQFLAS